MSGGWARVGRGLRQDNCVAAVEVASARATVTPGSRTFEGGALSGMRPGAARAARSDRIRGRADVGPPHVRDAGLHASTRRQGEGGMAMLADAVELLFGLPLVLGALERRFPCGSCGRARVRADQGHQLRPRPRGQVEALRAGAEQDDRPLDLLQLVRKRGRQFGDVVGGFCGLALRHAGSLHAAPNCVQASRVHGRRARARAALWMTTRARGERWKRSRQQQKQFARGARDRARERLFHAENEVFRGVGSRGVEVLRDLTFLFALEGPREALN